MLSYIKRIVLPEERKSLIKSLVIHSENSFADIISGKGAGNNCLIGIKDAIMIL
jgi:hypothetical protein